MIMLADPDPKPGLLEAMTDAVVLHELEKWAAEASKDVAKYWAYLEKKYEHDPDALMLAMEARIQ